MSNGDSKLSRYKRMQERRFYKTIFYTYVITQCGGFQANHHNSSVEKIKH